MLKHCAATRRNRIQSTSSNASCDDLIDLGNLFAQTAGSSTATTPGGTSGGSGSQRQLHQPISTHYHQLSPSAGCSISASTITAASLGGCFGNNNRWSSGTSSSGVSSYRQHKSDDEEIYDVSTTGLSGGSNQSIGNRSSNEDCTLSNTTSPAKTKHTTFRLPRRRPSANPAVVAAAAAADVENANNTEIVRRWNSFHSTRGECHPNRFRRNRKTSQNINPGRLRKTSTSADESKKAEKIECTILGTKIPYEKHMAGRHSVSYTRTSIQEETKFLAKNWHLKRGKSLADDKSLHCVTEDDLSGCEKNKKLTLPIDDIDENISTDVTSPHLGFGKRNGGSARRPNECFVLETSEMIVIEYPEMSTYNTLNNPSVGQIDSKHFMSTKTNSNCGGGNSSTGDTGDDSDNQSTITAILKDKQFSPNKQSKEMTYLIESTGEAIPYYHRNSTPALGIDPIMPHFHRNSTPAVVCSNTTGSNICYRQFGLDSQHHTKLPAQINTNRPELFQKCNRGSHSSDTSSAYSGSDTMTSAHSSSLDPEEVDLSGLIESVVDSDEEDLAESIDSLNVRDAVRECLEKDPSERNEDDIEVLLEFTQGLKAFTNMTLAVRRELCSVMVFAVVDKTGTMVMSDGEELDSWSVLVNGHVEIEHQSGENEELIVGDSFGILPTMDKLYHRGVMRTKCDDCQFVCITQSDYYRIQHQGEENIKRHEDDNGQLLMVTELRQIGGLETGITSIVNAQDNYRRAHIVIRGTIEHLIEQLVDENSIIDATYIEDFLLTHRTFIEHPKKVADQLYLWFQEDEFSRFEASISEVRDRVTRVILLWVNNHFTDFDMDSDMMEFLEKFESGLERYSMHGQLRLLHIACAAKARTRNITLTRSSRDEDLNFTIIGGYDNGNSGLFISKVDKESKAEDIGLKRGDQILEVNRQNFEHITYSKALETLKGSTHLSITIKTNLLAFKEMLKNEAIVTNSPRSKRDTEIKNTQRFSMPGTDQVDSHNSAFKDSFVGHFLSNRKDGRHNSSPTNFITLGPKSRIQKALIKMNLLPKNANSMQQLVTTDNPGEKTDIEAASMLNIPDKEIVNLLDSEPGDNSDNLNRILGGRSGSCSNNLIEKEKLEAALHQSHSNPDLKSLTTTTASAKNLSATNIPAPTSQNTIILDDNRQADYPECVLKVYKADQSCKYLLVNKETTAREVVMLALQEFGIHETSSNFSLCEVSVAEGGMIKQRRLPDQLQNLSDRITIAARYYLKTNGITETLVPDELAPDLVREAQVHFLQLNANEIAVQLTLQDFDIFRRIESTEYIDDLFDIRSRFGTPVLEQFSKLVNHEMFWAVTEICSEHNSVRRMKIIKQFIKIARQCKECRNFNSMFAIISGLGHVAVTRLRQTWEKLPSKYQKLFTDLQDLMDPSRNMSKYRQLVTAELLAQHPIIPFYPVVKKDLTFIHLGNDSIIENLINFEKLRMISKEIRLLTTMCSFSTLDLLAMLESKGQASSNSAIIALNQMMTIASSSVGASSHGHSTGGISNHRLTVGNATVKRRKKSGAIPNPKKMYEEAQMVRRVKAYLSNIKVVTNEDVLHNLSYECEPSTNLNQTGNTTFGSAPNTGVTIRKRHPSPTLSTTSSTSSTSEGKKGITSGNSSSTTSGQTAPKFGTASPQAVKKMLSLSESTKTRPHQSQRNNGSPGIPSLPLTNVLLYHNTSPSPSPGAHRRVGSSSSAGSVSSSILSYFNFNTHSGSSTSGSTTNTGFSGIIFGNNQNATGSSNTISPNIRSIHERSNSDTPLPLPVNLSVESSSVTSLSNSKKTVESGLPAIYDSGLSSCIQSDTQNSNNFTTSGGVYHVASSILHNSPTLSSNNIILQQRRHSSIHVPTLVPHQHIVNNSTNIGIPIIKSAHQHNIYKYSSELENRQGKFRKDNFHCNSNFLVLRNGEIPPIPPSHLKPKYFYSKIYDSNGFNESILNGNKNYNMDNATNGYGQHHFNFAPLHQIYAQPLINTPPPTSQSSKALSLPPTSQLSLPRQPPAYSVAAQMARLHRLGTLGRAHSHEGVASPVLSMNSNDISITPPNSNVVGIPQSTPYYQQNEQQSGNGDEENVQVSAV